MTITYDEKFDFQGPVPKKNGRSHTVKHDVYVSGDGPPVVIIQELPGIGPETLALRDKLVDVGFRVYLPHLFGPLGKVDVPGNFLRVFCMRREIAMFAANRSSPVTEWLKALCRNIQKGTGAAGVGVIGMCLSGNFAISMMADEAVLAAVASQPSLPLNKATALHMTPQDVEKVRDRLDVYGPMLAYRFEGDRVCNAERFDTIDKAFNSGGKERIKLNTLPGKGHSVLTLDFVDEAGHPTHQALEEIISYFGAKLKAAAH